MEPVTATTVAQAASHFNAFRGLVGFGMVCNEREYERAVAMLAAVMNALRNDPEREAPSHPLAALLDYLTAAMSNYEAAHHALPSKETTAD